MSRETPDWTRWCRENDLEVIESGVEVKLGDGRRHRVVVEERGDSFRLSAKVASRAALDQLADPELAIWQRNRAVQVVGFRIDRHDRLIGEARVPRAGLDAAEFRTYLRLVAAECDRLEVLLTGEDVE